MAFTLQKPTKPNDSFKQDHKSLNVKVCACILQDLQDVPTYTHNEELIKIIIPDYKGIYI